MKYGLTVVAGIDEIGFFSHAEALGYDSIWVADRQMLFFDCSGASATCTGGIRVPQIAVPGPMRSRSGTDCRS